MAKKFNIKAIAEEINAVQAEAATLDGQKADLVVTRANIIVAAGMNGWDADKNKPTHDDALDKLADKVDGIDNKVRKSEFKTLAAYGEHVEAIHGVAKGRSSVLGNTEAQVLKAVRMAKAGKLETFTEEAITAALKVAEAEKSKSADEAKEAAKARKADPAKHLQASVGKLSTKPAKAAGGAFYPNSEDKIKQAIDLLSEISKDVKVTTEKEAEDARKASSAGNADAQAALDKLTQRDAKLKAGLTDLAEKGKIDEDVAALFASMLG